MRVQTTIGKARKGLTFAIIVSIVAGASTWSAPVIAQERKPWTLFDIFRSEPSRARPSRNIERFPDAPAARQRTPRSGKAAVQRNARRPAATAASPELEVVEKSVDARKILIVGDFLGSGLAEGLTTQFTQDPNVVIVDRTKGSSGFVRDDVFDWPGELASIIEAEKPAAIVVMMGSNDRQAMRVDGGAQQLGTDPWNKEYATRAATLADTLETSKTPFLWVGLPPFKSPKMTSDMLAFNDVYKVAAEANKGEFVDIWDGFTDDTGAFVTTGPDVNGQPVKLRGSDGINLTKAGKEKLAFYVERPLKKLLGIGGAPVVTPPSPGGVGPVESPTLDRTPPMSLHDPEMDGGSELLGAQPAATPKPVSPQPAPLPGRADDNSWLRRQAEQKPATAPTDMTSAIRPASN